MASSRCQLHPTKSTTPQANAILTLAWKHGVHPTERTSNYTTVCDIFMQNKPVSVNEKEVLRQPQDTTIFSFDDVVDQPACTGSDAILFAEKAISKQQLFFASTPAHASLQRSAVLANRHADGCLEKLARSLSQLGHSVYLTGSLASASATEGSFEALRHKFLTVITNGEEFIVDPTFREQFRVQDPTPRFEDMLESVPQVAVAPLSHVLEVVAHIASEMWMCFESKEIPLPPWRRMRSLLSKWEGSKKMRLLTHLDIVDDQISSAENSADYPPKNLFSNLSPSSVIF